MPFADLMPTVVFPDNRKGKEDWSRWEKSDATVPHFCSNFRREQGTRLCDNRDPSGVQNHNLCRRCVAGYLYDFASASRGLSE